QKLQKKKRAKDALKQDVQLLTEEARLAREETRIAKDEVADKDQQLHDQGVLFQQQVVQLQQAAILEQQLRQQILQLQQQMLVLQGQIPPQPPVPTVEELQDNAKWQGVYDSLKDGGYMTMEDGSIIVRDLFGGVTRKITHTQPFTMSWASSFIAQKKRVPSIVLKDGTRL
ncbi:MAG: hypothetical protein ACTHJ4_08660, partial [Candidatus Nucleicultricaceae bacterium]